MKDYVFFPFALLVAVGMVIAAMSVGYDEPKCGPMGGAKGPDDYSRIEVSAGDLCRVTSVRPGQVELLTTRRRLDAVRITVGDDELDELVERGPHLVLGPDLETVFAGQNLTVSLTARSSAAAGSATLEVNYYTGKAGGSGWRPVALSPDWKTYQLEVRVPEKLLKETVALDYLGLRPAPGQGRTSFEVRDIVLERHGPWTS